MKQLLIILSTLTTLTLTSSSIINIIDDTNTTINKLLANKSSISDSVTSLFNNQYGYLNDSDIITNQSIIDHKNYSYDTSHANYLLNDGKTSARTLFIVNDKGELVYKKDAIIPAKDKVDVNNTKQEMISHKKIDSINNIYNPYSKSEYSNKYFSGDNTDWQYIQFGGVEKHIDISQQVAADKVEHSSSLSETLGLYYIAKAAYQNKITKVVAVNLGTYFMSQTIIKDNFNKDLTSKIINLISSNNNIFNFIYSSPMNINDKNYSINYIFDSNNNIISIYYTKWNNDNLVSNINVKTYESYSGNNDYGMWYYGPKTVISNFTQDGKIASWKDFITIYPTLTFDDNSFFSVYCQYGKEQYSGSKLSIDTSKIDTSYNFNHNFWSVSVNHDGGIFGAHVEIKADAQIWHDDHNIYISYRWYEYSKFATEGAFFSTTLNQSSFINIMK
ncbi:hypothetical protein [Spiroplasma endosymbiont of Aleiodes alternator]|uniref:hypothetical protein n=1 Tax=Spiroplasma endosymbiont of Aleiodes alternator TaxID=3139329 RepID=UPI003CCB6100